LILPLILILAITHAYLSLCAARQHSKVAAKIFSR
jgi:hypothetical protein